MPCTNDSPCKQPILRWAHSARCKELVRLQEIALTIAKRDPRLATCCESISLAVEDIAQSEGIDAQALLWGTVEMRVEKTEVFEREPNSHCWVMLEGHVFDPKEYVWQTGQIKWPFHNGSLSPFPWYKNYEF